MVKTFCRTLIFNRNPWKNMPSWDVKKYILTTSNFGKEIQGEINLYLTNKRLNEASFRRKLDLISKNIIKKQNPIELLFKDVKHFDAQTPVIGSWIQEVDIGRKKDLSKLLGKTPGINDSELRSRLNKFWNGREFFNNMLPPPSLPRFDLRTKQGSDLFQILEVFLNDIVNNFPPPPPPPPPLPPFQNFF